MNITVERPGIEAPIQITLTRGEINVPNVPYAGLIGTNADIAYVNLSTFTQRAGRNVGNAIRKMKIENPQIQGIVLDLRGNGGGLLSEAVNLSNLFIGRDEIVVTTKGKMKEWDRSFKTRNASLDEELPLVVLINDRSASASEIVSGVIQDYDRGVLVGQRSYGKGLVQNTKDIGYNAKIKLTTAKYYIPSGRCIQSVEYENGEPVDIPDYKRAIFKTRNGRDVLDGGGVAPDVKLDRKDNDPIIQSLVQNNLIFDFVTEYANSITIPDTVIDLQFDDYSAFLTFIADKSVQYETQTEKLMDNLSDAAKEEGYDINSQLSELERQIKTKQMAIIKAKEDVIIDLIEKELAGRYFYQEGKVRIGLRNDAEVQEAIKLLKNQEAYQNILNN
ncbi:MAG: S41 family peptidase [Saprospiraceae bacterium]|nr:S41 family peptidase [Saprospiraceae bacterium]